MNKQIKKRDDIAAIVGEIHDRSAALVRMVVNGKRNNPGILATYNRIKEEKEALIESLKLNQEA